MPPVSKRGLTLAAAAALTLAGPLAAAKLPGRAIARATGSGPSAIAVAHGQVDHPLALYARLAGKVATASILIECLVGKEATPRSYERRRPGLYRLAVIPADAEICHVTVTAYGRGRIVAEARAVT